MVAPAAPLKQTSVEAGNTDLQVQEGDLPDIRLIGANYMLYGVYQDWLHQNSGDHLDGGIEEERKWQAQWEKLVCFPTQCYDSPSRKDGKGFVGILSVELDRVCARKCNDERMIVFSPLSSNAPKALTITCKSKSAFCFVLTCGIMEHLTIL